LVYYALLKEGSRNVLQLLETRAAAEPRKIKEKTKMKATRFIAVGALALTSAAFADGIASDIVGYKATEFKHDGLTFFTPCFVDVGAGEDGADLTKLTPGGEYDSGDVTVSELDNAGRNVKDYQFKKKLGTTNWGWYNDVDGEWVSEGDVVIKPGQGVSIDSYKGLSLTSAGAVSTADRTITFTADGLTFCGNMTAVKVDLTAIIPGGEYDSGDITISKLDASGRNVADYQFKKKLGTANWGWYDDTEGEWIEAGSVFFEPGEGFSVDSYAGLSITIMGPDL